MTAESEVGDPAQAADQPRRVELGIWQLAWPTAASFLMQSMVSMVDFLIVSSLGGPAVAAVGMGSQVHFLQFALFSAVNMGSVALVARAVGAGDLAEADRLLRVSLLVAALMGLVLMCAIPLAEPMIGLFGVESDVQRLGGGYLRIMMWFSVPFGIGVTFYSALRGAGDVIRPLWVGLITNVLNVIGDYALVFGKWGAPALGVDGAAYASGASLLVGVLLMTGLWRWGLLLIKPGPWLDGLTWDRARRLFRIGMPSAMESVIFDVGILVFTGFIARFGTAAVSAYFIGTRVLFLSFVPGIAYQVAASTLVGQNLGAKQPEEARRAGWRAMRGGVFSMTCTGLMTAALAHPITSMFDTTGADTVELAVSFIYILAAAQPFMAVEFALGGALRGAGDTRFPLLTVFTGLVGCRLVLAWLVIHLLGGDVIMVWCCLLADYGVKAVMLARRFSTDRWQKLEI